MVLDISHSVRRITLCSKWLSGRTYFSLIWSRFHAARWLIVRGTSRKVGDQLRRLRCRFPSNQRNHCLGETEEHLSDSVRLQPVWNASITLNQLKIWSWIWARYMIVFSRWHWNCLYLSSWGHFSKCSLYECSLWSVGYLKIWHSK